MNAQDAQQLRLAAPLNPDLEFLNDAAIDAVMARLSTALHMQQPCALPTERDVVRAIGQQLAMKLWMAERAAQVVEVYETLIQERQVAWRAGWVNPQPWSESEYAGWRVVRGDDGRGYADYLALRGFFKPEPPTEAQRRIAIDHLWELVEQRADEVGDAYQMQIDDARKTIGPTLAAGKPVAEVKAQVGVRCPLLSEHDLTAILDEEIPWWLRWRHEHGMGAVA